MKLNLNPTEVAEALDTYVRNMVSGVVTEETNIEIVFSGLNVTAYIGEDAPDKDAKQTSAPPAKKARKRRGTTLAGDATSSEKMEPVTKTKEKVTKEPMSNKVEVDPFADADQGDEAEPEVTEEPITAITEEDDEPLEGEEGYVSPDAQAEDAAADEEESEVQEEADQTVADIMAEMEGKTVKGTGGKAKKSIFS